MKTRNSVLAVVLFIPIAVFSQNDGQLKIDSLISRLSGNINFEEKFDTYTQLYDVAINNDRDAAKNYLDSLATYSKKGKLYLAQYYKKTRPF